MTVSPRLLPTGPRSRSGRLLLGACAALVAVATAAPALGAGAHPVSVATTAARTIPPAAGGTIRVTQANLLSGQPDGKFAADARTVQSSHPDFITYNEVPYRSDALLAPAPYALWRTRGKYTGETPVAWDTDKWSMVAQGTKMLNDRHGRLPGQKVEWGVRYANWVTLAGLDGERVSVISAHLAPKASNTEGLAEQAIRRLGRLAAQLRASGPVLVGGDFNFHYTSRDYQRALLTENGFTPSYDVLGSYFPTGDHHGATIDYIFLNQASQFVVQDQYVTELNSDHDAVTVDLALSDSGENAPVSFTSGRVVNDPTADRTARRAVLDYAIKAIDNAPAGAGIHLQTARLSDRRTVQALKAAVDRGVYVQLVTRDAQPNAKERSLFALLGDKISSRAFAVGCSPRCRRIESRGGLPPTRLLVSSSGITNAIRFDIDQAATYDSRNLPTNADVMVSQSRYDGAFTRFFKLVGRNL